MPRNLSTMAVYDMFKSLLSPDRPDERREAPRSHFGQYVMDKVRGGDKSCADSKSVMRQLDKPERIDDALELIREYREEVMPKIWPVTEKEKALIKEIKKVRPRVPDQLERDLDKRLALLKDIKTATEESEDVLDVRTSWFYSSQSCEEFLSYMDGFERLVIEQAEILRESTMTAHKVGRLHSEHWRPLRTGLYDKWLVAEDLGGETKRPQFRIDALPVAWVMQTMRELLTEPMHHQDHHHAGDAESWLDYWARTKMTEQGRPFLNYVAASGDGGHGSEGRGDDDSPTVDDGTESAVGPNGTGPDGSPNLATVTLAGQVVGRRRRD